MNVSLTNKKILITGGTSALGEAFVKKAVWEGAQIYFTFFSDESKARELEALGAKAFRVNLASSSEIELLKSEIQSETKTLDGLIHNAAIVSDRTIQNLTEPEWDNVLNVNLKSVYLLSKEMLRFLLKTERSKILTVVSQVGLHGGFGQANYAAAKGGLIALTKSLAKELGGRKILVNALNPGFMESKMTKNRPADLLERNKMKSVIGEVSNPDEVADFMIYLMSDRIKRATGQIFHYESRNV